MTNPRPFFATLLLLPLLAAGPATRPAALGEKVVTFCHDHLGQQVGNGECAVLAQEALAAAGAKRRGGKDSPADGDYVWGDLKLLVEADSKTPKLSKGKPSDLQPGDVIQFRDAKLVHHSGRRTTFWTFGHHTAVISSVEDAGTVVHVLQQNAGGKKTVTTATLRLGDLTEGWMRIYRPETKPAKN